jgi:hypothetical protein
MSKDIVTGKRVQNLRCHQPGGSGSSGKLRPESISVTTGLKVPPDNTRGGKERDASEQGVPSSRSWPAPVCQSMFSNAGAICSHLMARVSYSRCSGELVKSLPWRVAGWRVRLRLTTRPNGRKR